MLGVARVVLAGGAPAVVAEIGRHEAGARLLRARARARHVGPGARAGHVGGGVGGVVRVAGLAALFLGGVCALLGEGVGAEEGGDASVFFAGGADGAGVCGAFAGVVGRGRFEELRAAFRGGFVEFGRVEDDGAAELRDVVAAYGEVLLHVEPVEEESVSFDVLMVGCFPVMLNCTTSILLSLWFGFRNG